MALRLSVPSKTFLLGEYAVLHQHPALVINTKPYFSLTIKKGNAELINISEASPAAKFFDDEIETFKHYKIEFHDPYLGRGGFGASSAQFMMLYQLRFPSHDLLKLMSAYKSYHQCKQGISPSGADVAAQFTGGITLVNPKTATTVSYQWPFSNLSFGLFHTGNKTKTHEHLQQLKISVSLTSHLDELTKQGIKAFSINNNEMLVAAVNDYADYLFQNNLTSSHTTILLSDLKKLTWVMAAKGCGALGNDIILVLFSSEFMAQFKTWCEKHHFFYVTQTQLSSTGLTRNLYEMVDTGTV